MNDKALVLDGDDEDDDTSLVVDDTWLLPVALADVVEARWASVEFNLVIAEKKFAISSPDTFVLPYNLDELSDRDDIVGDSNAVLLLLLSSDKVFDEDTIDVDDVIVELVSVFVSFLVVVWVFDILLVGFEDLEIFFSNGFVVVVVVAVDAVVDDDDDDDGAVRLLSNSASFFLRA